MWLRKIAARTPKASAAMMGCRELPVVQQNRRDVVPGNPKEWTTLFPKQPPSKADAHSLCVGCIRIDAIRTGRICQNTQQRWRNGKHRGQYDS